MTGGFFPLDPPGQFPLYTAAAGRGPRRASQHGRDRGDALQPVAVLVQLDGFGAGNGCKADQYLFPPSLIAPDTRRPPTGRTRTASGTPALQGWFHDSWFTDEARYLFNFNGAFTLQFYGDDDMFIFINGMLVVDLGGVHQRLPGQGVSVTGATGHRRPSSRAARSTRPARPSCPCATSADPYTMAPFNTTTGTDGNGHTNCTNATCDCRNRTVNLGLAMGRTYEIAVFGADRHPTESNYQLTLSGFATNSSNCVAALRRRRRDGRRGVRLRRSERRAVDGPVVRGRRTTTASTAAARPVQVRPVLRRRHGRTAPEQCDLGTQR